MEILNSKKNGIGGNKMGELEWVSIGKVAEKFEIELPRLRVWCNKGLIESDKRSTGRWIPSTEFPKIEKVKEVFASGGNVTFVDVKEELIKHNLYNNLQRKEEEEVKAKEMAVILEKALEKSGAAELFQTIAVEFSTMRKEISELRGIVENQTKLLGNQETMKNQDTKNEISEIKKQNEELKNLLGDLLKQKETSEEVVKEPVNKGFLSRIFGK